jgi:integrase
MRGISERDSGVSKLAGVEALRIHDLRHFAASTLTGAGVEDNIIGLLTGHKSRELRRYQHLREELKRKTVDLIAGVLKDAGKEASGSRLLHGAPKKPKSER